MSEAIAIVGYGPVGRATAHLLSAQGRTLRVAQRTAPKSLPGGATFVTCDALDAGSVRAAISGAAQVVLAVGFPYVGAVWREAWPRTITNFVEACAGSGARLIFVDNLYMYGPRDAPLTEATPLADFGVKPAARAAATRIWMEASEAGRVRIAALRAPDFYGPGVGNSWLGDTGFGALAKGKAATLIGSPDTPHDFAYVPDFARAVGSLIDAPDDAFGQAWHVPCAPTRSPREIFALGAAALGVPPARSARCRPWSLGAMGLIVPPLREMREMTFQWDRPYRVDFEPLRQEVLGGPDAVRGRGARDGAFVPRRARDKLTGRPSPDLVC